MYPSRKLHNQFCQTIHVRQTMLFRTWPLVPYPFSGYTMGLHPFWSSVLEFFHPLVFLENIKVHILWEGNKTWKKYFSGFWHYFVVTLKISFFGLLQHIWTFKKTLMQYWEIFNHFSWKYSCIKLRMFLQKIFCPIVGNIWWGNTPPTCQVLCLFYTLYQQLRKWVVSEKLQSYLQDF